MKQKKKSYIFYKNEIISISGIILELVVNLNVDMIILKYPVIFEQIMVARSTPSKGAN